MIESIQSELLLIVPVLWVLGRLLKEASFIRNRWIPLILGGIGVLLAVCKAAGEAEALTLSDVFTAMTQGLLCAGAAVYGHQVVKQTGQQESDSIPDMPGEKEPESTKEKGAWEDDRDDTVRH